MESITIQKSDVESIIAKYNHSRGGLIGVLEEVQALYSYLPGEALEIIADQTEHTLVDIFGVATFYKSFSLKPRGKHLCSICMGTACHVRGGPIIEEEFQRQLGIKAGETTADKEITSETVNCLGACALGPIVVVDGHYFSNVNTADVKKIIRKTRKGLDKISIKGDERIFPIKISCSRCNHSLMDPKYPIDDYPSIKVTMSFGRKHGWLRLTSLYGSYNTESEYSIPEDEVLNFFCPHCHGELIGASHCPECSTVMVSMLIQGGGILQVCPREGCRGHLLDV
ncbi:NAD(P)H-dependent oxidoreductase subunit E [bacterium]|nr:NAD(P)H-dependent oxidoreductase subunit E [bacterium]